MPTPQLLLGLAHGQVGQGTGRGVPQNQTGSPSLPPSWGPRGGLEGCVVKPYSVLGMEGGAGHEGLLENVFKTIKPWTFARSNLS